MSALPLKGIDAPEEAGVSRRWTALIIAAFLIVLALAIYPAITASLWLDETGTFWIVKDSFSDTVHRANWWSATSPAYYTTAWASAQLFGLNEIALRAPSVLFSLITAVLLFYLARRWLDAEHSLCAVLIFFCIESVNFSVVDARPYAFGLMLLVTAWLTFFRWTEEPGFGRATVFSLASTGVVYAHYLLALGLLPLGLYVICPILPTGRVSLRRFAVVMFITAVLLIPLVPQIRTVFGQRSTLSWAVPATWTSLCESLLRPAMLLFVSVGWLLSFGEGGRPWHAVRERRLEIMPLIAWTILPPFALFCLSAVGSSQLFVPRYYIGKEPGAAILLAYLLGVVREQRVRRAIAVLLVISCSGLNAVHNFDHGNQDWRAAVAQANRMVRRNPDLPIVVASGFVESMRPDYWNDPSKHEILFAPSLVYPLLTDTHSLPWLPGPLAEEEYTRTILPVVRSRGQVALLCSSLCNLYLPWLTDRVSTLGLQRTHVAYFGNVGILSFKRRHQKAPAGQDPPSP